MGKKTVLRGWSLVVLLAAAAGSAAAAEGWRGPGGELLPFETDEEILAFLREAEVVKKRVIPQGINKPLKMRLTKDGVVANAIFRTVNVQKPRHETGGEVYINFHDSYQYECAAYEVSRILGIDNVPPCVVRTEGRIQGTMQLWIENAMTEEKRRKEKREPPLQIAWMRQLQTMRLFDSLIYNFDRNQGNMLIDADWKLWFIDHTRSFYPSARMPKLDRLIWVEQSLWRRLRELDREQLESRIGALVSDDRVDFVLKRRDRLIEFIGDRIARLGDEAVVFDAAGASPEGFAESPDYEAAGKTDDIPEESPPVEGGGGSVLP